MIKYYVPKLGPGQSQVLDLAKVKKIAQGPAQGPGRHNSLSLGRAQPGPRTRLWNVILFSPGI